LLFNRQAVGAFILCARFALSLGVAAPLHHNLHQRPIRRTVRKVTHCEGANRSTALWSRGWIRGGQDRVAAIPIRWLGKKGIERRIERKSRANCTAELRPAAGARILQRSRQACYASRFHRAGNSRIALNFTSHRSAAKKLGAGKGGPISSIRGKCEPPRLGRESFPSRFIAKGVRGNEKGRRATTLEDASAGRLGCLG